MTYEEFPLSASHVDTAHCAYGTHKVPVDISGGGYELPSLKPQKVTMEELPAGINWLKWGRTGRATEAEAWHTYCADTKFETILRSPEKIVDTGARYAIEPDVSTYEGDPLPCALAGMWRRRCVARIWQNLGLKVAVNLNVNGWARALAFEGVPEGFNLFATKYQKHDLSGEPMGAPALYEDFEMAKSFAGDDLVFIVYGGGKKVGQLCADEGWLWIPPFSTKEAS